MYLQVKIFIKKRIHLHLNLECHFFLCVHKDSNSSCLCLGVSFVFRSCSWIRQRLHPNMDMAGSLSLLKHWNLTVLIVELAQSQCFCFAGIFFPFFRFCIHRLPMSADKCISQQSKIHPLRA